ncbi:hypothetical protein [Rhodopirellula europaea]|uniref:hypothetical protein n=1 Tax=Rhodopirellula europaea TaxID=1263866 RepID=UPI003D2D6008|tara:strand:- start:1424 stop:1855 length:432 start_codon:yes stop_codon:yes gene_type:complete
MDANPYAPAKQTEDAGHRVAPVRPRTSTVWLTILTCIQGGIVTIGLLAQLLSVDTILFSGPLLAASSLSLVLLGLRCNDRLIANYGYSGLAFIALVATMIIANDWGPPNARKPVQLMTVCYAIAAMAVTVRFTFRGINKAKRI